MHGKRPPFYSSLGFLVDTNQKLNFLAFSYVHIFHNNYDILPHYAICTFVMIFRAFIQGVLDQPREFPGQKYPSDGLQDLPCPQLLSGCHRLCQGL